MLSYQLPHLLCGPLNCLLEFPGQTLGTPILIRQQHNSADAVFVLTATTLGTALCIHLYQPELCRPQCARSGDILGYSVKKTVFAVPDILRVTYYAFSRCSLGKSQL